MSMGQAPPGSSPEMLNENKGEKENGNDGSAGRKKRFRAVEDENDSLFQALERRNAMQDDMERTYKMFACHQLTENGMRVPYRAETVWLGIRHALAWHDKPEGDWMNVSFDKPLNRSDQPQPTVKLTTAEDDELKRDAKKAKGGRTKK